jgi:transmembrane sensor
MILLSEVQTSLTVMTEEQFWILLAKKLCGEASEAELATLHALMIQNEDWQKAHDKLRELWSSQPKPLVYNNMRAEEAYLQHIGRLKETFPGQEPVDYEMPGFTETKRNYKQLKTYAVIALALLTGFAVYKFMQPSGTANAAIASAKPINEIKVANGSKSKIELPDGSQVWINSGSNLKYDNFSNGSLREVTLDGEAYFDVKRNPSKPFIVHTNGIDIRVLGTAFNVKAYHDENAIEATLIHGSIEVSNLREPNAPKVLLKPHEKLVFNKINALPNSTTNLTNANAPTKLAVDKSAITIKPVLNVTADSAIHEIAWVYNRLEFEEESFYTLIRKMERWFDVEIIINSNKLRNISITGSFQNETLEQALKGLQYLVKFGYRIDGKKVWISQ